MPRTQDEYVLLGGAAGGGKTKSNHAPIKSGSGTVRITAPGGRTVIVPVVNGRFSHKFEVDELLDWNLNEDVNKAIANLTPPLIATREAAVEAGAALHKALEKFYTDMDPIRRLFAPNDSPPEIGADSVKPRVNNTGPRAGSAFGRGGKKRW